MIPGEVAHASLCGRGGRGGDAGGMTLNELGDRWSLTMRIE